MKNNLIFGRHPVMETLKSGAPVDKIRIKKGARSGFFRKLKKIAAQEKIPISEVSQSALDKLCDGENHQGVAALLSTRSYNSVEEILQSAAEGGEHPFLLILNQVQDPHNLGSLLRSALGAGIHGVIIPRRRSAQLTPTVSRVSAGADAHLKVARVTNLGDTIENLKKRGIFMVGAEAEAEMPYYEYDYSGPLAIVMGGEEAGLGRRVKGLCDILVKIPLRGPVNSLNVGVAGGIIMFRAREMR